MLRAKSDLFFLSGILLLAVLVTSAQANTTRMSLKEPSKSHSEIKVYQGSSLELSNDFKTSLYNLMISKVSSGKKMMGIDEFKPGQSFNLEFPHTGSYLICYSLNPGKKAFTDGCLQINVAALNKA